MDIQPFLLPLAELADVFAIMIPIVALMIPIVAIWTKHKVQIEELRVRQSGDTTKLSDEVAALRGEMKELKDQMHQQLIAVDDLMAHRQSSEKAEDLSARLDVRP